MEFLAAVFAAILFQVFVAFLFDIIAEKIGAEPEMVVEVAVSMTQCR